MITQFRKSLTFVLQHFLPFLVMAIIGNILQMAWAQPRQNDYNQLQYHISLDKEHYNAKETIYAVNTISNTGDYAVTIQLVSLPQTSFYLSLRTQTGINIPVKVPWQLMGRSWKTSMNNDQLKQLHQQSKSIRLEPGESFSKTIDLQQIFVLEPRQDYVIRGFFCPDFVNDKDNTLSSNNWLTFTTRDDIASFNDNFSVLATVDNQVNKDIAADEIIFLHLKAELEKDYPRSIKYLALEDYIFAFDKFAQVYGQADEIEKKQILDSFTQYLSRDRQDYLLDFKIGQTEYNAQQTLANVHVLVSRQATEKPDNYNYIYQLKKQGPLWRIKNLQVSRSFNQ